MLSFKTLNSLILVFKTKWLYFLLAGLALLTIFVRFYQFGRVPTSLYWDEMAIWNDAQSISQTGRDMHNHSWMQPLFISYGDYKLPFYIWLTSLVSLITDNAFVGARLVSSLAGLSMIVGVYFLGKRLSSSKITALLCAISLATLPWSIHFSRLGFEGHLAAAFLLWSLVGLFYLRDYQIFIANDDRANTINFVKLMFIYAGVLITAIAGFYSYYSFRFVWPVLTLVVTSLWWSRLKHHWLGLLLTGLFWLGATWPMFNADFYQASNQFRLSTNNILNQPDIPIQVNWWRENLGNSPIARLLYNRLTFFAKELWWQTLNFFDPTYLFLTGDKNLRHGSGFFGLTWFFSLPLLIWGIISSWRHDKRTLGFLGAWWLIGILPAAVPLETPHALRSLNALPVIPLFMAIGGVNLYKVLSGSLLSLGKLGVVQLNKVVVLVIGFLILVEFLMGYYHYFSTYSRTSALDWQEGYHQLATYLSQNHNQFSAIGVNIGDDRFFLYYQPLSELDWNQIQQLPSDGFKRRQIENIYFEPDDSFFINHPDGVMIRPVSKINNEKNPYEIMAMINNTWDEPVFFVIDINGLN